MFSSELYDSMVTFSELERSGKEVVLAYIMGLSW